MQWEGKKERERKKKNRRDGWENPKKLCLKFCYKFGILHVHEHIYIKVSKKRV